MSAGAVEFDSCISAVGYNSHDECPGYDTKLDVMVRVGLMSWVFANGTEDWGSIRGQDIPMNQKILLDATLLNIQHYKVKWSNPGKGVAPSPTPLCCSY